MTASALVLSHLFPSAGRPGAGPFVADQVELLAEEHPLTVVAPVRWLPPVPYRPWLRERRVPRRVNGRRVDVHHPRVPAFPYGGVAAESRLLVRRLRPLVRRLARERNVKLVHAHFALPDGFAAAALARDIDARLALTVWGSDLLVFPRNRRLRRLVADAVSAADYVVAVSDELADRARELGARTVVTSPGGVPSSFADAVGHRDAKRALGLDETTRWIVWVGGLVPVKQPLDIVDAFAEVVARHPEAQLALVGDGPLRAQVEAEIARRELGDRVRLVGHVPRNEVALWQAAAAVFCNSSASEGTPLAVLEALVLGTPVAAYPVGGIPAALARADGGTVAAERTPAALAVAISAELRTPRDRGRVAAAAQPFLVQHAIEPVRRIYEEALDA